MSNPSHNDRMELEIFDSFSKTVMRNTGRNIASASKTIRQMKLSVQIQCSTYWKHKVKEKFIHLNILSMMKKVTAA